MSFKESVEENINVVLFGVAIVAGGTVFSITQYFHSNQTNSLKLNHEFNITQMSNDHANELNNRSRIEREAGKFEGLELNKARQDNLVADIKALRDKQEDLNSEAESLIDSLNQQIDSLTTHNNNLTGELSEAKLVIASLSWKMSDGESCPTACGGGLAAVDGGNHPDHGVEFICRLENELSAGEFTNTHTRVGYNLAGYNVTAEVCIVEYGTGRKAKNQFECLCAKNDLLSEM